ncbi:hypothetical protein ACSVC9_04510 [Clostridium sp. LBM24168]
MFMKKKWLAIVGSPRREKNTDLIVDYVIDGLKQKSIKVDKFFLRSNNISTKKAIVVGVCAGNTNDSTGYAIEGIVKPLPELGIKIVDVIEYYNTKRIPVVDNDDIRQRIIRRIKNSINF